MPFKGKQRGRGIVDSGETGTSLGGETGGETGTSLNGMNLRSKILDDYEL